MKVYLPLMLLCLGTLSSQANEPADTTGVYDKVLEEVVVTATRPVITASAEKTTYDASADPEAKAMNLLDLLRKVPGVTVDAQDNVQLNGSSDFQIQIDGRSNPMLSREPGKILKSIPASVVQRVEVISSPGAKYDAEGVGGVLNIVMKTAGENLDGWSLSVTAEESNINTGGNLYAMMQKGRLGMTLSLDGGGGTMPDMYINMLRNQADGAGSLYEGRMKNKFYYTRAQLDASIKLSEADNLAISGSWNMYHWKNPYNASASFWQGDNIFNRYNSFTNTEGRMNGVNTGIDYSHIFGGNKGHKLRIAYQFDTQPSKSTDIGNFYEIAEATTLLPTDYSEVNHNNMPQHMALAEYSLPLGEKHTIEAGGKMTWRNSTSSSESLDYEHRSRIAAIFASYELKAGNFSTKAGLRYEHTAQHALFHKGAGKDFKADYSNLVPSLTAGYSFGPVNMLSASYTMRISRPGINYLNPYVNELNPVTISQGNPYLHPERYNSIALAWNGMFGPLMLNSRLDYTLSNDGITPITTLREGVQYTTYANSLHSKQVSLMLFANLRIGTKTTLMCSLTPTYKNMRASLMENHGWQFTAFAGLQQKLPWKLNLGFNIFAMTPQVELQGRGMSQFVHMLTLSRAFLKEDRLNVTLSGINPFYGRMNIRKDQNSSDFTTSMWGHMNMRLVQVSISYRFGTLQNKVSKREAIDSDAVGTSSGSSTPTPTIPM